MAMQPEQQEGVDDLKRFDGHFLLFRKSGNNLRRKIQGQQLWFRHHSFESAEREARRLHKIHSESPFVIMQEIARLKTVPVDAEQVAA